MDDTTPKQSYAFILWWVGIISAIIGILWVTDAAWNTVAAQGEKPGSTLNSIMWGGCSPKQDEEFDRRYTHEEQSGMDHPCAPPSYEVRMTQDQYYDSLEIEADRYKKQHEYTSPSGCVYQPNIDWNWDNDWVCDGVRQSTRP